MIIKKIEVENFRCLKKATLECSNLTILVGGNGTGKSTFLKALEAFYTPNAKLSQDDFYNRDVSHNIVIQVTYSELTEEEKKKFQRYFNLARGTLTVEKRVEWKSIDGTLTQKYYGYTMKHLAFEQIRRAERKKAVANYNSLRQKEKYRDLPDLGKSPTKEQISQALEEWEKEHPDQVELSPEEHQFFGYKEVGSAYLGQYTRFVFIPAVKEASEEVSEGRSSALTQILDLALRAEWENWEEFKSFKEEFTLRYQQLMQSPEISSRRESLEKNLVRRMKYFAPETELRLELIPPKEISDISLPCAEIKIIESGCETSIERAGHGTQRAFIFSALQQLAASKSEYATSQEPFPTMSPHFIIGIEEPELYQHPSRQRCIVNILSQITEGNIPGIAEKVQVIYTTHSPLMVTPENFDQIRLLRRRQTNDDTPPETIVSHGSLNDAAKMWERFTQQKCSAPKFKEKLRSCMSSWVNEGFFAKIVVLVEGPKDRGIILGMAKAVKKDFEENDIAVIPCGGKGNILKLAIIFEAFGIPIYIIWDSDESNDIREKKRDAQKT